jgi:hypothetical protein
MLAFVMSKNATGTGFVAEHVGYPTSTPFYQLKVKINVLIF